MQEFNVSPDQVNLPSVQATGGVLDSIIGQVFIAVGAIALLFLVIGAFRYVISAGDDSQVQQAKNTIIYSVIGLVIAVSAFLIIEFVSSRVTG